MNPSGSKMPLKQEGMISRQEQFTEFKLRVPKNLVKKYNIMKINAPRPIKFDEIKEASMVRKTKKQAYIEEETTNVPTHGAGSVYNYERKEEARKKKRGYITKEISKEDLPYALRLGGKSGKRYTGRKEPMEHSAYYILTQSPDGVFEAVPVQAWYNFTPDIDYATLNDEEVEQEFSRRERTINHFATKYKLGLQTEEENIKVNQKNQDHNLIIHDDDEENEDNIEAGLEETSDDEKNNKKSGGNRKDKNLYRGKKKKKKGGDEDDEVNIMDSDEEEDEEKVESKEVDYMSESSSEDEVNELDDEPDPDKDIHAKAKDDLNVFSDTEDEESDTEKNLNDVGKELKAILKKETSFGESSDEDEDIDTEYSKSVVLQGKDKTKKKGRSGSNSGSRQGSRSSTPIQVVDLESDTANQTASTSKDGKVGSKRNHENASPTTSSKKQKLGSINIGNKRSESPLASNQQRSSSDGQTITEEAIRKYLSHKPLTVTDLMRKFIKKTGLKKEQVKNALAPLLRRIQPNQEKIDGKLFLSIKSKK